MAATAYNRKSSAVKRILSEARELAADPSTEYTAQPLESNIFEWHFTLRGPQDTEFEQGLYHGRIILPPEYPFRPPNLMVLTPNGRWELNKKICLSFTGYHEEMWQPAWGVRTALLGMQSLMAARAKAAIGIGALDYPEDERKRLAAKSKDWSCPTCAATCAELLGSASRPEVNTSSTEAVAGAKHDVLPEGLSVDAGTETRKAEAQAASGSNSSTSSGSIAVADADMSTDSALSAAISSSTSATSLLTPSQSTSSTAASVDVPASPDLSGSSTPQRGFSEITPHQVITTAGPVPNRRIPVPTRSGSGSPPSDQPSNGLNAGSGLSHSAGRLPSLVPRASLHAPHDGGQLAARMSAEILPAAAPSSSSNAARSSSLQSASQRVNASGARPRVRMNDASTPSDPRLDTRPAAGAPAGQPQGNVAAPVVTVNTGAAGQLAVVDRLITALTLLIGVLILRMLVL
ncbi:hypothetical protein V8E36_006334 [Tilletia maclaganii]